MILKLPSNTKLIKNITGDYQLVQKEELIGRRLLIAGIFIMIAGGLIGAGLNASCINSTSTALITILISGTGFLSFLIGIAYKNCAPYRIHHNINYDYDNDTINHEAIIQSIKTGYTYSIPLAIKPARTGK